MVTYRNGLAFFVWSIICSNVSAGSAADQFVHCQGRRYEVTTQSYPWNETDSRCAIHNGVLATPPSDLNMWKNKCPELVNAIVANHMYRMASVPQSDCGVLLHKVGSDLEQLTHMSEGSQMCKNPSRIICQKAANGPTTASPTHWTRKHSEMGPETSSSSPATHSRLVFSWFSAPDGREEFFITKQNKTFDECETYCPTFTVPSPAEIALKKELDVIFGMGKLQAPGKYKFKRSDGLCGLALIYPNSASFMEMKLNACDEPGQCICKRRSAPPTKGQHFELVASGKFPPSEVPPFRHVTTGSPLLCGMECLKQPMCGSFLLRPGSSQCSLYAGIHLSAIVDGSIGMEYFVRF